MVLMRHCIANQRWYEFMSLIFMFTLEIIKNTQTTVYSAPYLSIPKKLHAFMSDPNSTSQPFLIFIPDLIPS